MKDDLLDKKTNGSVSILSHVSNIFENIIYIQMETFMSRKCSHLLTGFRKNHSIQCSYCIESWRNALD